MTAKIIPFTGVTVLDLPPERILQKAIEADLDGVLVIGYTKDGEEYAASSYADGGTALWLLERTKTKLLAVTPDDLYVKGG